MTISPVTHQLTDASLHLEARTSTRTGRRISKCPDFEYSKGSSFIAGALNFTLGVVQAGYGRLTFSEVIEDAGLEKVGRGIIGMLTGGASLQRHDACPWK